MKSDAAKLILLFCGIVGFGAVVAAFTAHAAAHRDAPPQNRAEGVAESSAKEYKPVGDWYIRPALSKDIDGIATDALSLPSDDHETNLVIRCKRHVAEIYVNTNHILDDGGVRVRFDDGPAASEFWLKAKSDDALFSPAPVGLLRKLRKSNSFAIEYHPFDSPALVSEFSPTGLTNALDKTAACPK